jgi:hypothetical protein
MAKRLPGLIQLDLAKVVAEVPDVVRHEVVERRRLVLWNGHGRELVKVVTDTRPESLLGRSGLHYARDVKVEASPKLQQLFPGSIPISLHRHPLVLGVTRKYEIILKLRPDEALVII